MPTIPESIAREAESIARAIEIITERIRLGGTADLHWSGHVRAVGRVGCVGMSSNLQHSHHRWVVGLIAGGDSALRKSAEGVEDQPEIAVNDLQNVNLAAEDVLVGIATSGRTPYVIGAIEYAREIGAYAIGLACNAQSALAKVADLMITPVVGPELISGSTRMKGRHRDQDGVEYAHDSHDGAVGQDLRQFDGRPPDDKYQACRARLSSCDVADSRQSPTGRRRSGKV